MRQVSLRKVDGHLLILGVLIAGLSFHLIVMAAIEFCLILMNNLQ